MGEAIALLAFDTYLPTVSEGVLQAILQRPDPDQRLRLVVPYEFSPCDEICEVDGPFPEVLVWFEGHAD